MVHAAYVICTTPRSGSTLLCDLLTAGGAGQPASYFRRQDIGYWADRWGVPRASAEAGADFDRAYLAAVTSVGRGGGDLFGLRLMWDNVGEASRQMDAAIGGRADLACRLEQAFGPILFVHLSREDKAAQAASLVRAQRTGLWHLHADGSERERLAPVVTGLPDVDRLEQARDDLHRSDAAWFRFFEERGITPLGLTYEALAADPQTVLAALGRDPAIAARVKPRTAKMAASA